MSVYNPNSHDAVLGKILTKLEGVETSLDQHRVETRAGFERMGSRVGSLERFCDNLRGKIFVASSVVSVFFAALFEWFKSKFHGQG